MPGKVNPAAEEPEETGPGESAAEVRHLRPEPAPSSDEMLDILAEACEDEEGIDVEIVPQVHTVPIKRPRPHTFWRAHPKHAPTLVTFIHRPEGKSEVYYWVPNAYLSAFDQEDLVRVRYVVCISRDGTLFLLPIKIVPEGENENARKSSQSLLAAVEQAKDFWIKMQWKSGLGAYEWAKAKGDLGQPKWPVEANDLNRLLNIAFKENRIDSFTHPAIKTYHGEG